MANKKFERNSEKGQVRHEGRRCKSVNNSFKCAMMNIEGIGKRKTFRNGGEKERRRRTRKDEENAGMCRRGGSGRRSLERGD